MTDDSRDASAHSGMQRKLAAILSADVVGYSGLMESDETGTLLRLKQNRTAIFDPQVASHGGRVFKLMGDGALAEFASVVVAVNCALAIQKATADTDPDLPDAKRIRYRIGVNLGDIIIDGDDIYGEGVNVAARLQTLAPVGGIALSRIVREQVEGKAPCTFEDMGEHTVKNIERPVHVFSVHAHGNSDTGKRKADEPRKLSICVLPFSNMSGDTEQEYFSDGISEDIITDLSKVSALFVIARNTAFTFKSKNVDIPQVARQLKVSHVLEGSVRKAGGRVRITAQLIDGATGGHVWAERYDRDLNDIFALQDEISEAIVAALKLKLLPEEKKAIEHRGTDNVEAYNLYLMARQYSITASLGDARMAESIMRLCRRAIEIDPNYARAWALIAVMQVNLRFYMGTQGENGMIAANRALALDPGLAEAHAAKAVVLTFDGDQKAAQADIDTALQLDRESYEVNKAAARFYYTQRNNEAAIRHFEKASTLMESDYWASGMLNHCYKRVGDIEGARRSARRTLERTETLIAKDPNNGSAMGFAIDALALLGEAERAKDLMTRALLLDPTNMNMRYNMACTMLLDLNDPDAALDMLEPLFRTEVSETLLNWSKNDGDIDPIRNHPRYIAMVAAAQARLANKTHG
ncbi:MAG TPA: adenylate/guanylate cyclase domain-containing protein [Rhizomicrobium sp.]|nr:adenylate/guanylate cyclase domain-containing protein [Rhizomicrobium sp.]